MFRLTAPSEREIAARIAFASTEPLPDIGTSPGSDGRIRNYRCDDIEHCLGRGDVAFDAACDALCVWKHYDQPWIRVRPQPPVLKVGTTFAVAAHTYGLWSLNTCRVFDVIDEPGPVRQFGFAYRTLTHHVERGDARFWIEQRTADDSVWLCIHTISRLHHPLTRLLSPLGRRAQRRALRGAIEAIQSAVDRAASPDVVSDR